MVYFFWLAAGDRNQCRIRLFHNAIWLEIWKTALHKLVGIHGYFLLSECPPYSAAEGEKNICLLYTYP